MIKIDENALICDLAETYHIFNYREIAPKMVAIFSIGLRDDSRIKLKMANQKIDTTTLLLSRLVDGINLLVWSKTDDARKGLNRPKSILNRLLELDKDISGFASGKDFEIARNKLIAERTD